MFERFVQAGIVEELAPVDEWPICPDCDCGADYRPIQRVNGRLLAPCPLDHGRDIELEAGDLRAFKIHCRRLMRTIAVDAADVVELMPGLWSLGLTPGRQAVFSTLLRQVVEGPALLPVLQQAAPAADVTLIAPRPSAEARLRLQRAGVHLLDIRAAVVVGPEGRLELKCTGDAAEPGTPRLTIVKPTKIVLIEGTTQQIASQPYRLLELIVEAWERNTGVSPDVIAERFCGRNAGEFVRELRKLLSAGRRNAKIIKGWIVTDRNPTAYRLALRENEVRVIRRY
jgi:hypothetical protein